MTNFKIGDRVEILPNSINWDGWVDSMDAWVGDIGIIVDDARHLTGKNSYSYIRVSNLAKTDTWNFPLKCLRNLEFHRDEYYNETTQSKKFTIKDEPLQAWERF